MSRAWKGKEMVENFARTIYADGETMIGTMERSKETAPIGSHFRPRHQVCPHASMSAGKQEFRFLASR
jgi:hypothetical protein